MLTWPSTITKRLRNTVHYFSLRVWQRRLTHLGHAMVGFAGLCVSACGADQQQRTGEILLDSVQHGQPLSTTRPVTHVIVIGDSISEGLGAESQPLSYASLLFKNHDGFYPEDQGGDLSHHLGSNLQYVNMAHAGDTTDDVISEQLPALSARLEDEARRGTGGIVQKNGTWQIPGRVIVVMTIGGNDVQRALKPHPNFVGTTLAHSLGNLQAILDYFDNQSHFAGGISTYFGNVYDVTDGEDQLNGCMAGMAFPGMSRALDVWSAAYGDVAASRQDSHLIDVLGLFRGHGFNFSNPKNPYYDPRDTTLWVYDRDCIHPNNRGHNMIRKAFYERILDSMGIHLSPAT